MIGTHVYEHVYIYNMYIYNMYIYIYIYLSIYIYTYYIILLCRYRSSIFPHGPLGTTDQCSALRGIFQEISGHGADAVELPEQAPHIHGLQRRRRENLDAVLETCGFVYIYSNNNIIMIIQIITK